MINLSTYTASGPYFNKKKALAIGLSTAGAGAGLLVVPVVLRLFFNNFPFSGAMTLYGK